jgi:parallel beta-helix repeat protein
VATGTTTITALSEGISGSAALTVITPPPVGQCGPWPAGITAWIQPLPPSSGQAFYASPTGSDANPGTLAAPWQSVAKANSLQPGQILYLRAGTYGARGTTALDFRVAGTAAAPITVSGYPGDSRPLIQGRIFMSGAYIRLTKVVVDGPTGNVGGPGPGGEAIAITLKGTHLELSNSEVRFDQWHAGVGVDGASDYRVINNYIHDNGGYLGDYSTSDAQWNTSHGMYNSPSSYGLIANNVIEHNDAKGLMGRHDAHHIIVVNNTVVGNGRYGIDVAESTHDWILANNILLNNGTIKGGGGIGTPGSGGTSYVQINNVFWNNGTNGRTTWDNNATIINNLVADPLLVNAAVATDHQNPNPTTDNQLRVGSPAIGFSDPAYTLPYDITDKCRGSAPDAGAYER